MPVVLEGIAIVSFSGYCANVRHNIDKVFLFRSACANDLPRICRSAPRLKGIGN